MPKLRRNTSAATDAAAVAKQDRRKHLQELIATTVIPDFCGDDGCTGAIECGRDVFKECASYNDLAHTLNTLGVETLSRTKGNWKPQMVKNLFKDFDENHRR